MEQHQPETNNCAEPEPHLETIDSNSTSYTSPHTRRHIPYIVTGLLLALIFGGCAFYFIQHSNQEQHEANAYKMLELNNNPEDYRKFLESYPESTRAAEVNKRLKALEIMLEAWRNISLSGNVNDFIAFNNQYDNALYNHLCNIKIDSLDYIRAQRIGTTDAYSHYLDIHPDGLYASEASIAQGNLQALEVTTEEQEQVITVINDFFHGFETADETLICPNITAVMERFLNQENATKATVMSTINDMFNKNIKGCHFIVNRDINIVRQNSAENQGFLQATFTVDLHIERNNKGKTFGSYKCIAELTPQMLMNSLIMQEISKQYNP